MTDPAALAAIAAAFLIAGTVKGVVGLGLPTIALALMTLVIGLPQAMAILIVPALATNLWQAAIGGQAGAILRRHWPFFAAALLAVAPGAALLVRLDPAVPLALLGLLLVAYGGAGLAGLRPRIGPRRRRWAGPLTGAVNGLVTGLTGSFAFPGAFYLQAVGLPRDALVQAMGLLFAASTLALGLALGGHGRLDPALAATSAAAVVPAILGMVAGRRLRHRLDEATFRRLFHIALIALGGAVLLRAGA
jgi:hypothetical protein